MSTHQEAKDVNGKSVTSDKLEIHYHGSKSMPFIIGNETCERLGSIGTSSNLLVYFTTVFNMKAITATTLVNTFAGTANLAALPGAILCDTYFGRYKTLRFSSIASFMGMLVLMLTSAISKLHPPRCDGPKNSGNACHGPTAWQMTVLLGGLGLMVIGSGGIRPCNLAFGADQFDPNTRSGKKGIKRFFNMYYFSLACAMMISVTLIAYVQTEISWTLGLAIPTALMSFSIVLFFMGSGIFVRVKPEGTPLTRAVRVVVAAVKKRRLKPPEQPWLSLFNHMENASTNSKLTYTNQFRFLDKAAIIDLDQDTINPSDGSSENPWRLCTMQEVEETKCLVRVAPIWASAILYNIAAIQQQTFAIFQALQSDRRIIGGASFKIPATSYSAFFMIGITIWIPIYERVVAPSLRKLTGKEGGLTPLQRMACGMFLSIVTMVMSGLVEEKRRALALVRPVGRDEKRGSISPLSGFWLVPQLTLLGFSEALTVISQIELYYNQLPEDMRSISGSFIYIGLAVSNYLSNLLISVVQHTTKAVSPKGHWVTEDLNEGRLDLYYYLVGAIEVINLVFFIVCAKWYKYKVNTSS